MRLSPHATPLSRLLARLLRPVCRLRPRSGRRHPAADVGHHLRAWFIHVSSTASGITFQVYPPDATLAKGADGVALVTGRALPDAGPSDNAKAWIGAVPRDGNYLILVAMSAGGGSAPAPYNLAVSLP